MTVNRFRRNRLLKHALVWSAALALYWALLHPLAQALALDFQALLENMSQDHSPSQASEWYADRAWIPHGKALILAGAAPLLVLAFASLFYYLLPWRVVINNPLLALSCRQRWGLGLGILVAFCGACLPGALGLSVWFQVELYWWIQWYANVDPVMEQTREIAPLAVLPGMVLAGACCVLLSLRRPRTRRRPQSKKMLWARLLLTAGALLALPALALPAGGLVHAARLVTHPGPGVFQAKCRGCHDLTLPLFYIKTPAEWERTVKTQMEEEGVKLSGGQREDVLGFLLGMRSFSDEWTFRTRCQRCHLSTSGWDDRRPEDWAALVDRLARWSPYYFRSDVKAQVVRHLTRTRSRPDARLGLDGASYEAAWEVARVCSRCHPLSRGLEGHRSATAARIDHLFEQMNRKLARPLGQKQLRRMRGPYRRLLADSERLRRLFPHDLPLKDGWLKW